MSKTDKLLSLILKNISSHDFQETLTMASTVLEFLESKNDPEPFEISIASELNHFLTNFENLKESIQKRVRKVKELDGDKLKDLYERTKSSGSHVLFD